MPDEWDAHAQTWDQEESVRLYADHAFASLLEHVDVRDGRLRGKRILDFGCGTGLLTEKLAPFVGEVVAVDTSPAMIGRLREKRIANVTAVCADVVATNGAHADIPFSDFDLIVASSVCSFLPDYERGVEVLARTLSPEGYFVQWDWLAADDDGLGLTVDRVVAAFRRASLRQVYVGRAFALTIDDKEMPVVMGVAVAGPP